MNSDSGLDDTDPDSDVNSNSNTDSDSDSDCENRPDVEYMREYITTFTLDNASNNDKFMEIAIEKGLIAGPERHIRCFAHIINLAAQDVLKEIEGSLSTLKAWILHVRLSDQQLMKFQTVCQEHGVTDNRPVAWNTTRWNSTYDMLELAMKQKSAWKAFMTDYHQAEKKKENKKKRKWKKSAKDQPKRGHKNLPEDVRKWELDRSAKIEKLVCLLLSFIPHIC